MSRTLSFTVRFPRTFTVSADQVVLAEIVPETEIDVAIAGWVIIKEIMNIVLTIFFTSTKLGNLHLTIRNHYIGI